MRRLIDVLALGLVIGSIALQGAFLTAIRGVPGAAAPPQVARSAGGDPAALSAQVCGGTTDRKC
jgi:hypothetical protein